MTSTQYRGTNLNLNNDENSSGIRTPYTLKRSSELKVDVEASPNKPNELQKLDSAISANNMPMINFGPN